METTKTKVNENQTTETTDSNASSGEDAKKDVKKEKTFTQEELNDIITKRINKEKSKWMQSVSEAERLGKLSAEERAAEELKRQREELEAERRELKAFKEKYEKEQLLNQTSKELANKNLPIEFASILMGATAEATKENIEVFNTNFLKAVENEVNNRLKGKAPKSTDKKDPNKISKAQFKKMSLSERQELFNKDPELYATLKQ